MRILVIEDEEDLRDLICFTLESQFLAEVSQASCGNEAIQLMQKSGPFDCVVSDYSMPNGTGEDVYRHMVAQGIKTPFVLVSAYAAEAYPIFREYPIAGFISKPDIFKPLKAIIEGLGLKRGTAITPPYCAMRTSVILKYGLLAHDLYIKLSEGKFVKVFRRGDVFDIADFERFKAKTIEHLYIKSQDAESFLAYVNQSVTKALEVDDLPYNEALLIAGTSIEMVQEINKRLGFTPEAQILAKNSVKLALRSIVQALKEDRPFDIALPAEQSYLASHSVSVAHVSCGIASLLGWTSGPTFLKLSLAAFLHDITIINGEMSRFKSVEELALRRHEFTTEEVTNFIAHHETAARVAKDLKDAPPDVDTIIMQHHETPDGTGPLRLDHNSINPLSAVFIVAGQIVDFYAEYGRSADLAVFLNNLGDTYSKGNFKTVTKAITSSLIKSATQAAA